MAATPDPERPVAQGSSPGAPAPAPEAAASPPETAASTPEGDPAEGDDQAGAVNSGGPEASNRESRKREAAEDRVLMEAAQAGDRGAFRSLVERHQRRAFSIAFGVVRDENDAREIVQEAFLRVYKGLSTFEGGSSFFTWLYRIVHNLAIDLIRKPGRKVAELDESRAGDDEDRASLPFLARVDGADPADVVRRKEIAARIRSALEALPPYHRDVILLREIDGLSYEEMAEAMGVSKGTIMSRLFHARQKLQKALADCYAEQLGPRVRGGRAAAASTDAEEEPS